MKKHLHIISLNVPYPADYGGVYDLFYKLPALREQQIKIHLHCFTKDRDAQPELNKYCEEVFYYKRNTGSRNLLSSLPYIVSSRTSEVLIQRLLKDDCPILMEGIHCTHIINDKRFTNRKLFVRLHNVENEYYNQLYKFSTDIRKAIFYWIESKRLYKYEKKLAGQSEIFLAVTNQDVEYYAKEYNCKTIQYLPLFIPGWNMQATEGVGSYCLYHGNLEVEENEFAVAWLLKNVFKKIEIPFVVAGKNPSKKIINLTKKYKHVSLVINPGEQQMQDIILKAHIHVLPSFSNTGIKIKLLNALYNGRHCVINNQMASDDFFNQLCHVVNTADEFTERIQLLYHQPFTAQEKAFRKQVLSTQFNNEANARQLVKYIWMENQRAGG